MAIQNPGATGTVPVAGGLTNNNAAPSNNNVGALVAIANAAAPTYTEGFQVLLSTDLAGILRVAEQFAAVAEDNTNGVFAYQPKPVNSATYAPSNYQQAGSVTKANIKNAAGNVYAITVTNANAAVRYLQLHNKATAPVGTDVPQLYWLIPAGTATQPAVFQLNTNDFAPSEYFTTGIGWAISTTPTTFTDSATASEHYTTVRYF